ncbi:MarR family winged helix-turn-helix transcriptional regulator [Aurantimonas sp. VKM B-3413]|uniref:MarR family winged helix-turn-helix transcriptional regulator n=1 Tax=Aurantimonas sp. VKM B-3413 TaxID=2779401 RepID=UPI001E5F06A1|nr:MarR family transcriptional regulator [Aurantimonas sp. VKM B-3413]MCB8839115.1 MarR family transcriptional regulator [Aurantimonas sp. VKM B-3413]
MSRRQPAPARASYPQAGADGELGRLFKEVIRTAVTLDRELAAKFGLALTDLMCLTYLKECERPANAKSVAEHVNLSTGATTALLDRLEREGFIERRRNPADRRGIIIHLVEERAGPVLDDNKHLRDRLQAACTTLSDDEIAAVMRFFRALLDFEA